MPAEIINHYLAFNTLQGGMIEWADGEAPGSQEAQLRAIKLFDRAGALRSSFRTDEEIVVVVEYRVKQAVQGMRVIWLCKRQRARQPLPQPATLYPQPFMSRGFTKHNVSFLPTS